MKDLTQDEGKNFNLKRSTQDRRKAILKMRTLPEEEVELQEMKKRIKNGQKTMEKAENLLEEYEHPELKMKVTDSVFTLSRKYRQLLNMNGEKSQKIQDYMEMIKKKIE